MPDLAENGNGNYIAMKKTAERQGISLKYPERILPVLTQNNTPRYDRRLPWQRNAFRSFERQGVIFYKKINIK